MSKEKQIEEMVKTVSACECDCLNCKTCYSWELCEALYNAGYRKQSENVIELPCKVGDKVYRTSGNYCGERIFEGVVGQISIYNNGEIRFWMYGHPLGFACDDIGKTVFLNKEEAENALAKMKGGGE
jgi:hypothetical protein